MAWVRTLALVGLLLVVAPMATVAENPAAAPAFTATASHTPDGIRYDITVEPAAADGLWVDPGAGFDVVGFSGLVETTRGDHLVYRWDGNSPVVTLSLERTITNSKQVSSGPEFTHTDDWVLGPVPALELSWGREGRMHTRYPFSQRDSADTIDTNGPGVIGERYAFLGEYDAYSRSVEGELIKLVIPRGTELPQEPATVLDTLVASRSEFAASDTPKMVLIFALPDPARNGGESFLLANELWVHADSRLDTPNNVWLHEYFHSHQSFHLAPEMVWLREASAEYYGARLAADQGLVSDAEFEQFVFQTGHEKAVLADAESWDDPAVPYIKGTRTLANLDQRIRNATDGERSLDDVIRRLNEHDGTVTYDVFEQTVAAVAGESMDEWLWKQVYGSDTPRPMTTPWLVNQAQGIALPSISFSTAVTTKSVVTGLGISIGVFGLLLRNARQS